MWTILRKGSRHAVVEAEQPTCGFNMISPEIVLMLAHDYRVDGVVCNSTFYARNDASSLFSEKHGKHYWEDLRKEMGGGLVK